MSQWCCGFRKSLLWREWVVGPLGGWQELVGAGNVDAAVFDRSVDIIICLLRHEYCFLMADNNVTNVIILL